MERCKVAALCGGKTMRFIDTKGKIFGASIDNNKVVSICSKIILSTYPAVNVCTSIMIHAVLLRLFYIL